MQMLWCGGAAKFLSSSLWIAELIALYIQVAFSEGQSCEQCSGSVRFLYGPGSSDPYPEFTDPELDLDPSQLLAIFYNDSFLEQHITVWKFSSYSMKSLFLYLQTVTKGIKYAWIIQRNPVFT
jgi:hypothetical protein